MGADRLRTLGRIAVALAGLVAIVGSGGGIPGFCDGCGGGGGLPPPPFATMDPTGITVQVGTPVTFTVTTHYLTAPTYQWCRQAAPGMACTPIAGATGASITLAAANLADDGAVFVVTAAGAEGSAIAAGALAVSALPPVLFQDGEFDPAAWSVVSVIEPAQNGPTASRTRPTTGGNPGAYAAFEFELPVVPSSVQLFHTALAATYDPVQQGAIASLDVAGDCLGATTGYLPYTVPMFEQAGRVYSGVVASTSVVCADTPWATWHRRRLGADQFEIASGPACGAGEACPDFSSGGAPLRFGYVAVARLASGLPPGTVAQMRFGLDNWRIAVWRR